MKVPIRCESCGLSLQVEERLLGSIIGCPECQNAISVQKAEPKRIRFSCSCGRELSAPEDKIGQRGKCPHCGTLFVVGQEVPQAEPAPLPLDLLDEEDEPPQGPPSSIEEEVPANYCYTCQRESETVHDGIRDVWVCNRCGNPIGTRTFSHARASSRIHPSNEPFRVTAGTLILGLLNLLAGLYYGFQFGILFAATLIDGQFLLALASLPVSIGGVCMIAAGMCSIARRQITTALSTAAMSLIAGPALLLGCSAIVCVGALPTEIAAVGLPIVFAMVAMLTIWPVLQFVFHRMRFLQMDLNR